MTETPNTKKTMNTTPKPRRARRPWKRPSSLLDPDRIRYTCAKCGGSFIAPDSLSAQSQFRTRAIVRIGGQTWCETCARARFPRREEAYAGRPHDKEW